MKSKKNKKNVKVVLLISLNYRLNKYFTLFPIVLILTVLGVADKYESTKLKVNILFESSQNHLTKEKINDDESKKLNPLNKKD